MNRHGAGVLRVPPVPPPPGAPPDTWGRRLEGLTAQADRLLLSAEFNASAAQSPVCLVCRGERGECCCLQQDSAQQSASSSTSIRNRIATLYTAATKQDGKMSNLKLSSNLVDRLVNETSGAGPARLVVSLQQDLYILGVLDSASTYTEVARLGYDDKYLLDCVDSESIPVIWIDLLQELNPDLFHNGNVICEIRDYRVGGPTGSAGDHDGPVHRHVLLRPSTHSVICDSLRLAEEALARVQENCASRGQEGGGQGGGEAAGPQNKQQQDSQHQLKLSSEERSNIESQLILSVEPSLCLDPSPVVGIIAHKTNQSRLKFSTPRLRRHVHKHYSQAAHNRKRKLESLPAPPELKIYDFIQNLKSSRHSSPAAAASTTSSAAQQPSAAKRRVAPIDSLKEHQERSCQLLRNCEEMLRGAAPPPSCVTGSLHLASPHMRLAPPSQVDVDKYARPFSRRPDAVDMSAQVLEEYILETAERGAGERGQAGAARVYHTRLTILQRQATEEYIGELYVERDFKDEEKKGSTCRFPLGTKTDALKYINQFTEIFTEEGRKSVEITHKVPGQQPRVTYTPGLKAIMAQQAQAAAAAQNAVQTAAAAAAAQAAAASAAAQSATNKKIGEQTVTLVQQNTPNGGKALSSEANQAPRATQITLTSQVATQPSSQLILSKSSDGKIILSQSIAPPDFSPQQQQIIPPSPQQQQQIIPPSPQQQMIPPSPQQQVVVPPSPQMVPPSPQQQIIPPSPQMIPPSPQQQMVPPSPQGQMVPPSPQGQMVPPSPQGQMVAQAAGGGQMKGAAHILLSPSQTASQQRIFQQSQTPSHVTSQTLVVTQAGAGRTSQVTSALKGGGGEVVGGHILTASGGQIVVSQSPQVLVAQQQQGQQPGQQVLVAQQQQGGGQQVLLTQQQQQGGGQQVLLTQQQQQQQGGGQQVLLTQQQQGGGQQVLLTQQQQSSQQLLVAQQQQSPQLIVQQQSPQVLVAHQQQSPRQALRSPQLRSPQQQLRSPQQQQQQQQLRSPQQQQLVLSPNQIVQNKSPGKQQLSSDFQLSSSDLEMMTGGGASAKQLLKAAGSPSTKQLLAAGSPSAKQLLGEEGQLSGGGGQTIISSQNIIPSSAQIVLTQGHGNLVTVSQSGRSMAPPGGVSPSPQHIILSAAPQTPAAAAASQLITADGKKIGGGGSSAAAAKVARQLVQAAAANSQGIVHHQVGGQIVQVSGSSQQQGTGGQIVQAITSQGGQQLVQAVTAGQGGQLVQQAGGQIVSKMNPGQLAGRLVPIGQQQQRHQIIKPQHSQVTLVQQHQQPGATSPQQLGTATSPGRAVLAASPAAAGVVTSSSSSSMAAAGSQDASASGGGGGPGATAAVNGTENQQEAISAIVQMFMSAEAQFEQKKMKDQQQQQQQQQQSSSDLQVHHQTDNNLAIVCSSAAASSGAVGGASTSSIDPALLPTVPVPPSSLVGQRLPTGGRVTLTNLNLKPNIPVKADQQQVVKVTLSQLAAQLARPVTVQTSSTLPSYSQAVAASQQLNNNPTQQATAGNSFKEPTSAGSTLSLQELLSEERGSAMSTVATPVSVAGGVGGSSNSGGLLERLMAGGSTNANGNTSPSTVGGGHAAANLNPLAGQLPTVVATPQQQQLAASAGINGAQQQIAGSDEISLAGLLSNPVKPVVPPSSSPTKISPLLQQLKQPVQSLQSRQYPSTPSPKHQLPPSPRTNLTSSPRSARSPRPGGGAGGMPSSPRPTSSLQQQLMQPPAPKYPNPPLAGGGGAQSPRYTVPVVTTTQSILSAQLSQPPRSSSISLTRTNPNQTIVVSSPDLVQVSQAQGFLQVSQGQILQVTQQPVVQSGTTTLQQDNSGQLQLQTGQSLQLQGLSSAGPANIQVQLPQGQQVQLPTGPGSSQQQQQPQQQALQVQPNQSNLVSMNLVPSGGSQLNGQSGGILTLGQVQVVNQSIPVQLSIPGHTQPYTISVSLPDSGDQSLSNGTISELKTAGQGGGSSFGRLLNGPNVSGGVVLQSSTGSIFQIPSSQSGGSGQDSQQQLTTSIKSAAGLKQQQVMVRPALAASSGTAGGGGPAGSGQPNSVLLQMPAGNMGQTPIRIVRSLPINQQQQQLNSANTTALLPGGISAQVKTVAAASPQGGVSSPAVVAASTMASPQQGLAGVSAADSPLYVQLQQQQQNHSSGGGGGDHHYVQLNQKQVSLVNQSVVSASPTVASAVAAQRLNNQTINQSMLNQTHLKIRPQRKQSLK